MSASQRGSWRVPQKRTIDDLESVNRQRRRSNWSPARLKLARYVEHRFCELLLCLVICVNTALIIHETNERAAGKELNL
eukprot:CAMPEP_0115525512 /NCGR_PEP_ID=MMETSP0271-20121206/81784_1 /TAXON_ID=71861 /ORGANISM="Scrippsiella trochoidea, Strain CCMP3099" /LENGTH=78 /DNA_ID=CAMNT_0002957145 /DNA_START=20 /DNA_END=253 /DNA_ORIENTATION=+